MAEKQKQEKLIPVLNKLIKKTLDNSIFWEQREEGFVASFGNTKDKVEFSYQMDEDDYGDEGAVPSTFVLIFINEHNVKYEVFYCLHETHPGYSEFKSLFNVIQKIKEEEFLAKCDSFLKEE